MLFILLASLVPFVLSGHLNEHNRWIPGEYGYRGVHDGPEQDFANEWTVVVEGGEEVAQLVALELGYTFGGKVIGFPDMYTFYKYTHAKERRTPPTRHTLRLVKDRRVHWAEPQFSKSRMKRYPTPDPDATLRRIKRIELEDYDSYDLNQIVNELPLFNDELWGQEWYLRDTRTMHSLPRLDLNVLPVYMMGYNGSGVRVSVLDDGIEYNHTDLRANYDPDISWDCNDHDADPSPRRDDLKGNAHGTRCAGEIAMTANNLKCGVGVAWGAKVGGVRMLDGRITDRIEGEAIAYAVDKVDIYSASWGPNDDGRTVEGPGHLALEAFKRGVKEGRGGKGAIYVWANGNGGGHGDNCNCNGYSSNIYTISIGSASQHGQFPWYGEVCSSTLATAYSSGAYVDQKIATTDTNDSCTLAHTGTSAAAPLAAGIIALALSANPNLTWRDVQHLIVWTSDHTPLTANPGWQINAIGLHFDVRFGFGLMNAGALVQMALNWTTVPEKTTCRVDAMPSGAAAAFTSRQEILVSLIVKEDCKVNYIEHVELVVNVHYSRRGALEAHLISPKGTKVQLLNARKKDLSTAGFVNWPLMSVFTWGENPKGVWTAMFSDATDEHNSGKLGALTLIIHGTSEAPEHMKNGQKPNNRQFSNPFTYNVMGYRDHSNEVVPVTTDGVAARLGEHRNKSIDYTNDVEFIVWTDEKQLQRTHHRKQYNGAYS